MPSISGSDSTGKLCQSHSFGITKCVLCNGVVIKPSTPGKPVTGHPATVCSACRKTPMERCCTLVA
jgi:hypothetical protein